MNNLLEKLRQQECSAMAELIAAPVLYPNSYINVNISGVRVRLKVIPRKFIGFGKFRTENNKRAVFVEALTFQERRRLLNEFPSAQLIVCIKNEHQMVGRFANEDGRFDGTANICFADGISLFDVVDVAFNGNDFIYISHNKSAVYKKFAEMLLDKFNKDTFPDGVFVPRFWKDAYEIAYKQKLEAYKLTREGKIQEAIRRAGGTFNKLVDRGNLFTVEFTVNGQKFSPVIDAQTLRVESAGFCLSGEDKKYDLQALVHVAAGAVKQNRVVRGDYSPDSPQSPYYVGRRNNHDEYDYDDD